VVAASGIGSALGTVVGNVLKNKRPEVIALIFLAVDTGVAVLTTVLYSAVTVVAMGFVAGLASRVAKLGYDALVQSDVPESVRTSVFGRSEAVFQIFWVAGGFLGIGLPLVPRLGFGVIAGLLVIAVILILVHWIRTRARPAPAAAPAPEPV
jgi:hypothetical protein